MFDDSSITLAQWRKAQKLSNFGYPQVPNSIPAENPVNSIRYGFDQMDPQARVVTTVSSNENKTK